MVDGLGERAVQVLVVAVLMMVLVEVLMMMAVLMEASLLLMRVLGVVDGDDEGAVEVKTDAEFDDADVEIVAVNSVEVLPGVALENVESEDEEVPLVGKNVVVALGILDNMLDDSALDGEEALLEEVGKIEVLNVLLEIVDVAVVLVGTTELGAPTLEVVSVVEMSEMVLDLDGFSAVLSCEGFPTSIELDVASTVEMISVSLVVDSVVSCVWVERPIVRRVDCLFVDVFEYSLLVLVIWPLADEEAVGIVIMV